MESLITAITDTISGVFTSILTAFAGVGDLIFVIGDTGITGIQPFGYILALLVGIPVASWLFSKLLGLINRIRFGGSSNK